jgi:putative spermidine/putrescine transport system substrate-binding protein
MNKTIVFCIVLGTALILAAPAQSRQENARLLESPFSQIQEQARGSQVRWTMFGGWAHVNAWVDGYVAAEMKQRYAIDLVRVPMDAEVFVNKLLSEKAAGREKGTIDLLWINGENFKNAREAGLLFGPFAEKLPNVQQYVDPASVAFDFGYPVEGYEAPYGRAQFVFEYDTAQLKTPPESVAALKEWIQANPGRFTYPQPPDFTGSAFIRQLFYALSGGPRAYLDGFDADLFEQNSALVWEFLNRIEPYLWQQGQSYPKDLAALDTLFERGAVDINMSYTQTNAQSRIEAGRYPDTVRSFVMAEGSLFNTHFTAIPFNAPNKPGALTTANFLLSPEAQYSKNQPANWGDFTVLETASLSPSWRERFENLDLGAATLPFEILEMRAVPEVAPAYVEALETGWEENVLKN